MRAFHNSRDTNYRFPYGAIQAGGAVQLSIDVFDEEPREVSLRTWVDGQGESYFPMSASAHEGFVRYTAELTCKEPALVWYLFVLVKQDGQTLFYVPQEGRVGGEGELCNWMRASFQLTVYTERATKPSWYSSGIAYQIFPDSFSRDKNWRTRVEQELAKPRKGPARHLMEEWSQPPYYCRDEQGNISQWNFYGGTLKGIQEKLGYLKDLGVTILYLNPIFEAASPHRYDTADYETIDPLLGTEKDFKELCAAAESYGISIILDGVFNHTGQDSRYFNAYGNYPELGAAQSSKSKWRSWYKLNDDGSYESWWGVKDLPDLDENDPSYRGFIFGKHGVVQKWLKLGAKGWRLDVVDELPDDFVAGITTAARDALSDALILGEVWEDASNKTSYSALRKYFLGDELDCAMNYYLRDMFLAYLLGNASAGELTERLETIHENYPPFAFEGAFNMLGTHDTMRLLTVLGGAPAKDELSDSERASYRLGPDQRGLAKARLWLAALLQMTLPGVPCIYYGDEAGVEGYTDPYNRSSFPWENPDKDCMTIYRNATMLRRSLPALSSGSFELLHYNDDVFAFRRRDTKTGECVVVLVNRSCTETHDVQVDMYSPRVSDVVSGRPVVVENGKAQLRLWPLGSSVLYFAGEGFGKSFEYGSGILAHISSVPNETGQATLGASAHRFVDWLAATHQSYWQILPVNPTDEFGSPYAGLSAFAGNIALLDKDALSKTELTKLKEEPAFERFCKDEANWLDEYACFMAIKDLEGAATPWQAWKKEWRRYSPKLLSVKELKAGIAKHRLLQYAFHKNWNELHSYARQQGVSIIGDIPMYVSQDSADVWAHQELFQLDESGRAQLVAGAPPDNFTEDGQIWGNPVYRWDVLKEQGYSWWIARLKRALSLYDALRLDHFLGFSSYYAIAQGQSAKQGNWQIGPGRELFAEAYRQLGPLPVIAEDLGVLTPATRALVASCGFYGMDVCQFADNAYEQGWQPKSSCISYTSTHDTETLPGWCERLGLSQEPRSEGQMEPSSDGQGVFSSTEKDEMAARYMRAGAEGSSPVVIYQLQDVLLLGNEARMNVPGVAEGNWSWQATTNQLSSATEFLTELTKATGRAPHAGAADHAATSMSNSAGSKE